MTVISRSWTNTGFDYWLGARETPCDVDIPFNGAVRLEVSGIYEGDNRSILRRVREKFRQTEQSDQLGLPAYIIVVEFGQLVSKFTEKKK